MQIIPVPVEGQIEPSDDLAGMITASASIRDGDVLVVSQKAVSKLEGRLVNLSGVEPSLLASGIASQYGKDPRVVELVLSESRRIVRLRDGIIIVETNSGIVCANAGVDESNVKNGYATLLPLDPDGSAQRMRDAILGKTGRTVGVIISDTLGRAFRRGQTDCAIGVAGLDPILDYRGTRDSFGRDLHVTEIAVADELAAAAELVMQKTAMRPAALVRDYAFAAASRGSQKLLRPRDEDLFR